MRHVIRVEVTSAESTQENMMVVFVVDGLISLLGYHWIESRLLVTSLPTEVVQKHKLPIRTHSP